MSLEFEIPQDAEEGWYNLVFSVHDEDGDQYENSYDDELSESIISFKIEGGCIVVPKVSISASLISGGMSGEQMVVKATVSNTGTSIKEYSLSATGYTGWASSVALVDTCVWASDEISIEIESDFVVLDNFEYSETISCGSTVQIMADVFNIGDSDQDEVSVQVYNKKLELFKTLDIGDINAFDNEVLSLEFEVPQDAEEGWYALEFTVYDEDNDVYENNYDDEQSTLDLLVKIEGGCIVIPKVSISASLISGGMSGEQMVVKATVSNTGTSIKEYSLSATGYTGWASSVALDAETFNLGAGQSKEVLFTFEVNRDASGTQLFDIEVVSEGQLELKQPVQVSITKKAGFLTGNMISEGNWYVWGIGALNVLLILIIIIVAIKVAKK